MTIRMTALLIILPLAGMVEEHNSLVPAIPAESTGYDYR